MANCPNCGGTLRFDIQKQALQCQSCKSCHDPYQVDANSAETSQDETFTVFACPNCGGELYSTDHDLTGICSYCGSPVVFEARMQAEKRPVSIIPFQKTKADCKNIFKDLTNSTLFLPNELKDPKYLEGFRGIYMPHWVYRVDAKGHIEGEGKKSYTLSGYDYVDTVHFKIDPNFSYYNILHDASSTYADELSEKVEPYELGPNKNKNRTVDMKPFTPSYLSGFYAEPCDVEAEKYYTYAQTLASDDAEAYIKKRTGMDRLSYGPGKSFKELVDVKVTDAKLMLLPVWFLSYRNGDRVAYATINGQTGKATADLPVDTGKFFLTAGIAAAALSLILSLFLLRPMPITVSAIWFALSTQRYAIHAMEQRLVRCDKGEQTRKKDPERWILSGMGWGIAIIVLQLIAVIMDNVFMDDVVFTGRFCETVCGMVGIAMVIKGLAAAIRCWRDTIKNGEPILPVFLLPTIAAFFGMGVVFAAPHSDLPFYAATSVTILMIVLSMLYMIFTRNELVTRPVPQLFHKGGDDRG